MFGCGSVCLSVCLSLLGLFACLRHVQGLASLLKARSGKKNQAVDNSYQRPVTTRNWSYRYDLPFCFCTFHTGGIVCGKAGRNGNRLQLQGLLLNLATSLPPNKG